ncbi:conserved hypothetical protein [Desulfosarcina cetonica]|nr:conserved hypothetical protein [Desulfosarcina cetonica]
MSWTDSKEKAEWFAYQYYAGKFGLSNPAVFTLTADKKDIWFYTNDRNESEFVLRLPLPRTPRRI